jgi:hypothetical protein
LKKAFVAFFNRAKHEAKLRAARGPLPVSDCFNGLPAAIIQQAARRVNQGSLRLDSRMPDAT